MGDLAQDVHMEEQGAAENEDKVFGLHTSFTDGGIFNAENLGEQPDAKMF